MKKLLLGIGSLLLLSACSEELPQVEPEENGAYDGIVGQVPEFVLDGNTKTSIDYNPVTPSLTFSWLKGDKVAVFGKIGHDQQLALRITNAEGDGKIKTAEFTLTQDFMLGADNQYVAYYPVANESIYMTADNVLFDYTGQVQEENSETSTSHLGSVDFMFTDLTTPTGTNKAKFTFRHKCCPMRIIVSNVPAGSYAGLELTADGDDAEEAFTVSGTYNILTGGITSPTKSSTATVLYKNPIKFTESDASKNTLYAWVMISPTDYFASHKNMKVNLLAPNTSIAMIYDVPEAKQKEYLAGHSYSITCTEGLKPDYESIDLGLPTGTLWATMNVGAASSTDNGYYYGWGWKEPGYGKGKSDWYAAGNKTLDDAHDPATIEWGPNWRTPTAFEFDELLANCSFETVDDAYFKVTSNLNQKYIYIPKAGSYTNNSKTDNNVYFKKDDKSVSVSTSNKISALAYTNTTTAAPVRPVRVEKTPAYVDFDLPSGTLWAIANLGAYSPAQNGNKYAWGECEARTSNFSPKYYKLFESNGTTSTQAGAATSNGIKITKYTVTDSHSASGTADNQRTLKPDDDAATQAWGADWTIPTKEQWEELEKYCTITYSGSSTSKKLIVSRNGKSIELPNMSQGYWSSTLYDDDDHYAYGTWTAWSGSGSLMTKYDRCWGKYIRPVSKKQSNE